MLVSVGWSFGQGEVRLIAICDMMGQGSDLEESRVRNSISFGYGFARLEVGCKARAWFHIELSYQGFSHEVHIQGLGDIRTITRLREISSSRLICFIISAPESADSSLVNTVVGFLQLFLPHQSSMTLLRRFAQAFGF